MIVLAVGGLDVTASADAPPPITATWTGAAGDGLWETPGNWDTGVVPDNFPTTGPNAGQVTPTQVGLPGGSTVTNQTWHTVDNIFRSGSQGGITTVRLGHDLRLLETNTAGIDFAVNDGFDLNLGASDAFWELRSTEIFVETTDESRTPQIGFFDGPVRTYASSISGSSETPLHITDISLPGRSASLILERSKLFGGVVVNLPLVGYGDLDLQGRADSILDARLDYTDSGGGTLTVSNLWSLGPNGSIDLRGGDAPTLRLISRGTFPSSATFEELRVGLDLSRVDVDAGTTVVFDQVNVQAEPFLAMRNRAGTIDVQQNARRDFSGPGAGIDLTGGTYDIEAFTQQANAIDSDGTTDRAWLQDGSRLVLYGGTLRSGQPGGGPVVLNEFVSHITNATLDGGVDLSGYVIDGEDVGVIIPPAPLSNVVIRDGPIRFDPSRAVADSLPIVDGEARLRLSGWSERQIDVPYGPNLLSNVTIESGVSVNPLGRLTIENGLVLDGTLVLSLVGDAGASVTFQGDQTVSGTGQLIRYDNSFGGSISTVRAEGDLTIGEGVSFRFYEAVENALRADTHDVTLAGHIWADSETTSSSEEFKIRFSAGTFKVEDSGHLELLNASQFDAERLVFSTGSRVSLSQKQVRSGATRFPDRSLVTVAGMLNVDGHLTVQYAWKPVANDASEYDDLVNYAHGDQLRLFSAESVSGQFDSIEFRTAPHWRYPAPGLDAGLAWAVLYETNAVVAEVALLGDANLDGAIEQGDLNAVLSHWGQSDGVSWVSGDLTQDGVVDQADLNAVLTNWGSGAAPSFAGFAVPEPGMGLAAALLGVAGVCRRR